MRVERQALISALKTVTPIVERRNTIPILGAAKISAERRLTIETTDLDMRLRISLDYEGATINYCQLSPKSLIPLLRAVRGDGVEIEKVEGKGYTLASGELSMTLGQGLPSDDWPELQAGRDEWSTTIGSDFMDKLKRVALAQSSEETRYYLNGVYFHHVKDWTYRLVATDGHRLIYANVEMPDAPDGAALAHAGGGAGSGVILPKKAVATLIRLHAQQRSEPIQFSIASSAPTNRKPGAADLASNPKTKARFKIGDVEMLTKLIDGTFPDYTRVIPAEGKHVAEASTADMRRVVAGLFGFMPNRVRGLTLAMGKSDLTMSSNAIDLGATASLRVPATVTGGEFEVGFNGGYMLAMLAAIGGETVRVSSESSASPTLFYDPASSDVRTVLMPMRVG